MDYRIAKQVRSAKFSDLVTANIVQGTSTLGSFRKAISQKAKARATRIKEKFDPLNIVKFMTGGSKLAPAVLGRLLGRSQRDIEYFSGTARLIGGRNTRIGTVDKQGMELGILTDIYKFLNKSYEYDKRQRDLQTDFAEERKLEDERRHKELIKAIQDARGGTAVPIKEKDTSGGFMDMIKNMFESFKTALGPLIDKAIEKMFGGAKALGALLRFLGSRVFGLLLGPLAAVGTIVGLVYLLSKFLKYGIDQLPDFATTITQEDAQFILKNFSERDKQEIAKSFRGGLREIEEIAVGGVENAKEVLERGDKDEIMSYGGRAFLERLSKPPEAVREPDTAPPRPGGPGDGSATGLVQRDRRDWDEKYKGKYDPVTGLKLQPGYEDITAPQGYTTPKVEPRQAVPPAPATMGGTYNRMPGATTTPMQAPQMVPSAPAGATLTPAMSENRDLRMAQRTTSSPAPTPSSAAAVIPAASSVVQRPPIPAVRNLEESFQRMIYNSIRVV